MCIEALPCGHLSGKSDLFAFDDLDNPDLTESVPYLQEIFADK